MSTTSVNISATQVKDLREKAGAPMMDCKQALTEAKGDMEQAVVILRKVKQRAIIDLPQGDALARCHWLATSHQRLGNVYGIPYNSHRIDPDAVPKS